MYLLQDLKQPAAMMGMLGLFAVVQRRRESYRIAFPAGDGLAEAIAPPVPGFVGRTNSYPTDVSISSGGRYAALLKQGYGTEQSSVRVPRMDFSHTDAVDSKELNATLRHDAQGNRPVPVSAE
jgi:hypothetical protein